MKTRIERFEDILVWQESRKYVLGIYEIFRHSKDYSFRDQIRRAAVSVMNNIAEGYERHGNKEFSKFLYISKGSCGEVRSMLYLAHDLKYISEKDFNYFMEKSITISRMLSGFIKSMREN